MPALRLGGHGAVGGVWVDVVQGVVAVPVLPRAVRPVQVSLGAFHPLRVDAVVRETDEAISVTLKAPEGTFEYVPGQYLTVRASIGGEEVRRSYSICSGAG